MLSACVAAGIGVSLLGTDWCINPIVLRVELWFDGKHVLFIHKIYEVKLKLYLLQATARFSPDSPKPDSPKR